MNARFKPVVALMSLLVGLAGCGSADPDDYIVGFAGSLSQRPASATAASQANTPLVGKVCIRDRCRETSANGDFNLTAPKKFKAYTVLVAVTINSVDTQTTIDLPANADEVRMALSVDQDHRNLVVDSLNVIEAKGAPHLQRD